MLQGVKYCFECVCSVVSACVVFTLLYTEVGWVSLVGLAVCCSLMLASTAASSEFAAMRYVKLS